MEDKYEDISDRIVKRLTKYLTILTELRKHEEFVNSIELSKIMNTTAAQVRRDLSTFGEFGVRGKGYDIENLITVIESILGINEISNVIIVGHGRMGELLSSNSHLLGKGFKIVGVFEKDKRKINKKIPHLDVLIKDIEDIESEKCNMNIDIAILAVTKENAQFVADKLINYDIKVFFNMTTYKLEVADDVLVVDSDISSKLQELNFWKKYKKTNSK